MTPETESGSSLSGRPAGGRYQLPLLPAPPGFSHAGIVVVRPTKTVSKVQEEAWREALKAELQKEQKLAHFSESNVDDQDLQNLPVPKKRRTQARETSDASGELETSSASFKVVTHEHDAGAGHVVNSAKAPLSPQRRLETKRIRALGACIRCGIYKEKVRATYLGADVS